MQLSNTTRITIRHKLDEDGNSLSELVIVDLHKSDEGSYICVGSNGVENLIDAVDNAEGFITIYGRFILHNCVL